MRQKKYGFGSFAFLFLLSLAFLGSLVAGADQLCRNDINKRLPNYPNSELISQEKDLIRYRAAGISRMVFHSEDDPEAVALWFRELNLEQLDQGILRGFADIRRTHEPDPKGGTTIYYQTSCAI